MYDETSTQYHVYLFLYTVYKIVTTQPYRIFGVENRNRLSNRVSCEKDSDFRLRL